MKIEANIILPLAPCALHLCPTRDIREDPRPMVFLYNVAAG
jgi:hypothetical protein